MMNMEMLRGIMIPFIGTSLGAAMVFLFRKEMPEMMQWILTGFAAGVMTAAAIWSLLLPSLEQSEGMGRMAFIPAVAGFWFGILFLLFLDTVIPHMHMNSEEAEGPKSGLNRTIKMVLAVALHNIPEGMAVGIVYAGWESGNSSLSLMGALALSLGIAIQNFPEGAIISLPLASYGTGKKKAFGYGVLSGAVEPLAALVTIGLARFVEPALPYFLSFAAGAMIYVVVEELIPEMSEGNHSNLGTIFYAVGFSAMIILDVTLQ